MNTTCSFLKKTGDNGVQLADDTPQPPVSVNPQLILTVPLPACRTDGSESFFFGW
jgi:hypothetical protein